MLRGAYFPIKRRVTKSQLRLRLAAELRDAALGKTPRAGASAAICQAIRRHRAWPAARLVCAFLPLPSEPQIASLWEEEHTAAFCFPRVRDHEVDLIRIDDLDLLLGATWKLDSAAFAAAPVVDPQRVDLFLVPGLAFTARGLRLGRGGGFYDRLLPRRNPRTSTAIGVCFAQQVLDDLPHEPHDQKVDCVVTEYGLLGRPRG